MSIGVITSGFLPVPASKGGAVENLLVNILNYNEIEKKEKFIIFSTYDKLAIKQSRKYNHSEFVFIKPNNISKLLDKIVFFVAKNILKKENSQSYRYIFQRLNYLSKVSILLKKNNYDKILLENHPTQFLALKWRKNYLKYKDRYYYHCHNEFPGTYKCKDIIAKTKKIICVSHYIANTVSNYLKLDSAKFVVLRNGIENEKFQQKFSNEEFNELKNKYGIEANEKVMIFTGRIVPEKGVKELLEAMKLVKNNNCRLLIIGAALNDLNIKTKYQLEIEDLVKSLGKKVVFTGYVNYADIYKYYAISDIAVLPSIWNDPAPMTIIESLTCGLPIITTDSGGIPEYATNGSAIILKRDDNLINNLAKNIDYLLENDSKRNEMKKICKDVSKELTARNYFETFCKYMEESYGKSDINYE